MDVNNGKAGPGAPIETFARFQAGFLSSEVFIVFYWFSSFFVDFHEFRSMDVNNGKARQPLEQPLLDSRLASCHLRTFIVF